MPRVYERKFDWDEARRRYAAGESIADIARRLGVTWMAVGRVVIPGKEAAMAAYHREYQRRGKCDDCGGPMNQVARNNGSTRCKTCADLAQATSVRPDELRCITCREWKPDEAFPFNRSEGWTRRGRHQQCRACLTVARRNHRQRNREKDNAYQREYRRRRKTG